MLRTEVIQVDDERIRPAEVYQDVPVETEIITSGELRRLPAVNAIDALDALPGIRITSQVQGQRGAVRIDGLPPEYSELLVNGQRYAGENGEAIDLGDILYADTDRIEIMRGPQALRYTSRAAGGVVNFITRDPPTDGWAGSLLAAGGDQDRYATRGSLGFGTEKLGTSLIYAFNQEGGFDSPNPGSSDPRDGNPSNFGEGSLFRTHDLYATLVSRPRDSVEIRSRLGYRIRDEGFAVDDGPVQSRREEQRWLANLEATVDVTESTRAFGRFTASHNTLDTDAGRDFVLKDDMERLEFGVESYVELLGTTHIVTLGADIFSNGIDLAEGDIPDSISNPNLVSTSLHRRYHQAGIYLITESEITEWLTLEGGIRREENSDFRGSWLPQGAIMLVPWRWDAERAVKLRVSAGRSARYPTNRELFQPDAPQNGGSYFLAGNEFLVREKIWAARASIEANPTRWISGTVAGFYSEVENRIRASFQGREIQTGEELIPADPALCPIFPDRCFDQIVPLLSSVFENDNLDELEIWGIEARLEFRPREWIELQLGYTWNRTRVVDSNVQIEELPNTPEHIANAKLTLTWPRFDTVLTTRAQWRDRALIERSGTGLLGFTGTARSRDSFDVDLRLLQPLERLLGYEIDLFVDANNVTDNRVIDSNIVRGASYFVGIQARFD